MTPATAQLHLAISPCPNDTFVFHALVHGLVPGAPPLRVSFADVDVTNTAAEQGSYDVAKVSYAALPWLLDGHVPLQCGGALGRGCGPLVVVRDQESRASTGSLAGWRIAVPGERTTAYLLLRLWARQQDLSITVLPYQKIMPAVVAGQVDAGLIIHESRFIYAQYGLSCLVDLGQWWEEQSMLPIPLGVIVVRHGSVDPAQVSAWIRESLRQAWADPDRSQAFVREHAQESDPDVVAAHIDLYVNEFTDNLGELGRRAVETLLGRAGDAGLIPAVRSDLWAPE